MLRIRGFRNSSTLGLVLAVLCLFSINACQPMPNSNGNANGNANANTNSPTSAANVNSNSESDNRGATINTREPDKYSATLAFSIETQGGDKAIGIPSLALQVARNGDDRRL